MKKYIFTESQVKKVIDHLVNEQYSGTDSPEDMHHIQGALNRYFQAKNIRGTWDGGYSFKLNPKAPIIVISEDGAWGDKSSAALAIFQKNNGLKDDGMVGCCSATKLIKMGYLKRDLFDRFLGLFGWEPACSSQC
jgi:hypothetical protein